MLFNNTFINYRPNDSRKRLELTTQQMAAQEITPREVLPIQRCILEEIDFNNKAIVITVTYVSNYKLLKYFLK